MAFDALVAQAVALEIRELVGARLERITQVGGEEIGFAFYGRRGRSLLFYSAHAAHARLHLVGELPSPTAPSPFALVLRRHLEGCLLEEITLPPLERVITLHFQSPPIRGEKRYRLVAEIMGRHSNLILVEPGSGLILDGLKRYGRAVSRYREVFPGQPYLPPPSGTKADLLALREEDLGPLLLGAGWERPLEKALIQQLHGLGPQLAREVVARAGLDPNLPVEFCGSLELARLWQALSEIRQVSETQQFQPTLVWDDHRPVAYAAIPLKQYGGLRQETVPRMSLAVERFYRELQARERREREKSRLEQLVAEQQKRWARKVALYEEALSESRAAERYRLAGELIIANLHRLTRGMTVLEAPNPYQPDEIVRLELDPSLTPAENAQRQFKKYRKARAQAEQAAQLLAQAREELAYWETVQESLERAETMEDLAEIGEELARQTAPPARPKPGAARPGTPAPLSFTSPDGYTVLVGKNNRQNDYLVARLARPEDVWLHARGFPGAHVLVRNPGGAPLPPATLEYAAGLAAFYSKARLSALVAVDYTLAKHVHKSKGARPGMVHYTDQQTILVRPLAPTGDRATGDAGGA